MIGVYRYLKGYIRVVFSGEKSEKILNLCAKNRITFWNSRILKNGIETHMYMSDFKNLRIIMQNQGLRAHIIQKKGLPIITNKNRKRLGMLIGVILMISFLKIMCGYIWVIDVEGNKIIKTQDILTDCRAIGIYTGIHSNSIDAKSQREKLLLKNENLSWASLNVEGCRLTVNVSEIKENHSQNIPSNLKAKADGIIKKIDVTSGNCIVKTGDTVKKGDILVSGINESDFGTQFVHSVGVITAETRREICLDQEYIQTEYIETGRAKNKYVLDFFTLKIPLYLGSENQKYNSYCTVRTATLFGKSLPIKLYGREFRFVNLQKIKYSREQLIERLDISLEKAAKKEGISQFTVVSKYFNDTEKGVSLTAIIASEEDIVLSEPILVTK